MIPFSSGLSRASWVGAAPVCGVWGTSCSLMQQKRALKRFRLLGFFGEDFFTWPTERKYKTVNLNLMISSLPPDLVISNSPVRSQLNCYRPALLIELDMMKNVHKLNYRWGHNKVFLFYNKLLYCSIIYHNQSLSYSLYFHHSLHK